MNTEIIPLHQRCIDCGAQLNASNKSQLCSPCREGKQRRHMLKLADAAELTPPVDEVGEWATELRKAAFNAVSEQDITDIMRKQLEKAKAGDSAAAKMVLGYLTGGGAPKVKIVQQVVVAQQNGTANPEVTTTSRKAHAS